MPFDGVCKFVAETFTTDITTWLLGEPVELARLEPSELLTRPIHADTLVLLASPSLVLHVEFQVEPKQDIPFRMADYRLRAYRRYPEKEMRQVVVYLRRTNSPRVKQTSFELTRTRHEFDVLRLWEQPVADFQQLPGLLPFAVLAQTNDPEQTLRQVSERISAIEDRQQRGDVAASAAILAGLVLEDKSLIRSVLREDVMKESVIYQDIVATAEEKGRQKEGLSLILRLLARRVGTLSPERQQQVEALSLESLEVLGEALLDFTSEADLVTWLQERA